MEKADIRSYDLEELKEFFVSLGEKPFRAKQAYSWLHQKHITDFGEMTDFSKQLREKLAEACTLSVLRQARVQQSKLDGTRKYLFALPDGNLVESVFLRYKHGNSVCVSSQAGCRMGCRFCASTLDGLARNLTPGEMLEQVYRIREDVGERVSNVVVMGMGEPLDNYQNLLKFLQILTGEGGENISGRNVTVSTCGLVPQMRSLAEEKLQLTLAVSLHAPTQEKRLALMPIAAKYAIHEVIDACRHYFARTGRRVTFEYSLMAGVNDTGQDARQLAELLRGLNCHVNLIPVNPVRERGYAQPERAAVQKFKEKLERLGVNATVRREMGRDIDGACGQLRRRYGSGKEL